MTAPRLEPISYLGTTVQAFQGRPKSHDHLLRRAAERWPAREALIAPSGTFSYVELDVAVSSATLRLRTVVAEASQGQADRIAVALDNDAALFSVPFVASRAGVTAVLLNTTLTPRGWAEQLRRARPAVVIVDASTERSAKEAIAIAALDIPVMTADDAMPLRANAASLPVDVRETLGEGSAEQVLALIATSGTTGVPKMSEVTSQGLIHAALGYVHLLGLDAGERSYICLPLHYIGPLSAQTTTMPLVGGCNIIPADASAAAAAASMDDHDITFVDAVPAWLGMLMRHPGKPVPTWRTLIYGGAPMPPETAATLARRHPGLAMWDVWGLSETHGPATALRYDPAAPALAGTVGRPLPGVEVRTDDAAGGAGELLVRGLNVTPGYADDPVTSAEVLAGGWLRTGDIGVVKADGTVRLLDRAKDVIMRGGGNVFGVEVEQCLAQHPDVREAAVFGVPDGMDGEAVAAVVVLRDGASLDVMALRAAVAEAVGRHAVPRRIRVAVTLPRNSTGKIDKVALRRTHLDDRSGP